MGRGLAHGRVWPLGQLRLGDWGASSSFLAQGRAAQGPVTARLPLLWAPSTPVEAGPEQAICGSAFDKCLLSSWERGLRRIKAVQEAHSVVETGAVGRLM